MTCWADSTVQSKFCQPLLAAHIEIFHSSLFSTLFNFLSPFFCQKPILSQGLSPKWMLLYHLLRCASSQHERLCLSTALGQEVVAL